MNHTSRETVRSVSDLSRRELLKTAALGIGGAVLASSKTQAVADIKGERPQQADGVTVLNPRGRVPVSLVIDDSTCLVNLAHFLIPQFKAADPSYRAADWRKLPREIPDDFVREFGQWCHERGIKGKYSIVPYPACVGWVDRELPGWPKRELYAALKLVHDLIVPDWDIHPEMVSHTLEIDTKTGRPYAERSPRRIENWGWNENRSTDEFANYIRYALQILKNVGFVCQGVTSPGGFGAGLDDQYARGVKQAFNDVFPTDVAHYWVYDYTDQRSVEPRVKLASGLSGPSPSCVVELICCTDDWFGGWDGVTPGSADLMITPDLKGGRLPDVISREEPVLLLCHWAGMYYNGRKHGFNVFKQVVKRLHNKYDNLIWMKLSEISRYWAARKLTAIKKDNNQVTLQAPFAAPNFTVNLDANGNPAPKLHTGSTPVPLNQVNDPRKLTAGAWIKQPQGVTVCFDLPKGRTRIEV